MAFEAIRSDGSIVIINEKVPDPVYSELYVGNDGIHYKRATGGIALMVEPCERQPAPADEPTEDPLVTLNNMTSTPTAEPQPYLAADHDENDDTL
jgi:hypothetical protein